MRIKFKIKKVFLELILTYLFTISIPIILAIVILITAKDISLNRQIDSYSASLEQGMNLFEVQLENYDRLSQQFMFNYELFTILQLDKIELGNKNMSSIVKFQNNLNERLSDIMIRDNYCMLFKNGFAFDHVSMYHNLEFLYKYSRNYEHLSYNEYINMSFLSNNRKLFPMQNIITNVEDAPKKAMTYSWPIRMSVIGKDKSADAVVQFLIKEEFLHSIFAAVLSENNTAMYIMDSNMNILANIGNQKDIELSIDNNSSYVTLDGGDMAIYVKSKKNNYSYIAVIPREVAISDALNLQKVLIIWISIFTIIDILLGIFFSWKYSLPIKKLVNNIQNMLTPNSEETNNVSNELIKNEFDYLQESFQKLVTVNRDYKSNSFYNHLLSGEFNKNEDIINEALKIGLNFKYQRYCVSCIDTGNEEIFKLDQLPVGYLAKFMEVHSMGQVIAIICGYEKDLDDDSIYEDIMSVTKQISFEIQEPVYGGIGLIYSNEAEIAFSYNQAGIALASGRNNDNSEGGIIKYSTFSMDRSIIFYPTDISEKLINFTRNGEMEKLQNILDTLEEENFKTRKLSVIMKKLFISDIVSTLLKLMSDDMRIDGLQTAEEILSCSDFSIAMLKIKEQFKTHCSKNQEITANRRYKNQSMMHAYMEENYMDSQLTLGKMADDLAFSEGYFSQFFKENIGEVFSKYLEQLRIQKAKELIKDNEHTLEKISEIVGYSSSSSFRRAFKRVTGTSPSIWK